MSKVAVVVCKTYDFEEIYNSLLSGINALGGLENFVNKEDKILIKPNFLYPVNTEKVITTNPVIIKAFAKILNDNNFNKVIIGDSPANGTCRQAFDKLGLSENDLYNAKIADMNQEILYKGFPFVKEVSEVDSIIGLCKMKTHALEKITGALKNMYGLICGKKKALGHAKYRTDLTFARMLCDIHKAVPIKLHIMDGVVAMEGNGPSSGTPVKMNVILISKDPIAIDSVFAKLINLKPALVPTITQGKLFGIGESDFNNIEITLIDNNQRIISIDELVKLYGKSDYKVRRDENKLNILSLWSILSGDKKKPHIDESKCIKCGVCVKHCPVDGGAINFVNGNNNPPIYNYKKCIRCYCCQELCPAHAIEVK